jgi:cytochrome c
MRARIAAVTIICSAAIGVSFSSLRAQEASSASRSVWDGVFTNEQSERGQKLFGQYCAKCHGDALEGSDESPTLVGAQFLSDWNELTVGGLFERIRKSMPQDKPGRLSREVNADILAYMLGANGFPAGQTELAHQTEILQQIRIESSKPNSKKDK